MILEHGYVEDGGICMVSVEMRRGGFFSDAAIFRLSQHSSEFHCTVFSNYQG